MTDPGNYLWLIVPALCAVFWLILIVAFRAARSKTPAGGCLWCRAKNGARHTSTCPCVNRSAW